MYFGTKSYLKSTRNHTAKHALRYHVCHDSDNHMLVDIDLLSLCNVKHYIGQRRLFSLNVLKRVLVKQELAGKGPAINDKYLEW
jgi:hypothetical protein